jgi:hypothetical protein
MILHVATSVRNNGLIKAIRDALDADDNPGYIEFYTAPMPETGGAAITTQTLLGTCTLTKPSGTIDAGTLTFDSIADDEAADDSGTIAWARFKDGAGNWVMDGDCGATGSGAVVAFNILNTLAGGLIKVVSGALTEGGE